LNEKREIGSRQKWRHFVPRTSLVSRFIVAYRLAWRAITVDAEGQHAMHITDKIISLDKHRVPPSLLNGTSRHQLIETVAAPYPMLTRAKIGFSQNSRCA
jgi:hypothetical protein